MGTSLQAPPVEMTSRSEFYMARCALDALFELQCSEQLSEREDVSVRISEVLEQAHDGLRLATKYREDGTTSADATTTAMAATAAEVAACQVDSDVANLRRQLEEEEASVAQLRGMVLQQTSDLEERAEAFKMELQSETGAPGGAGAEQVDQGARAEVLGDSKLHELLGDAPAYLQRLQDDIRTLQAWQGTESEALPRAPSFIPDPEAAPI